MIAEAVLETTTDTHDTRRVTACVSSPITSRPMMAPGSGSPVGEMIDESPVPRSENGKPTTCVIVPMIIAMMTITPKMGQNRPRVSCHERTIASRIVVCSITSTDVTSKSLVDSQTARGMLPSTSTMPRMIASGGTTVPSANRRAAMIATSSITAKTTAAV